MAGTEPETFCEEINGGASIESTVLADAAVDSATLDRHKQERRSRQHMADRNRSTIARFNRFYGETPIKLFDSTHGIQGFKQVPWEHRLGYRMSPGTFVYDEANRLLYLNGTVQP